MITRGANPDWSVLKIFWMGLWNEAGFSMGHTIPGGRGQTSYLEYTVLKYGLILTVPPMHDGYQWSSVHN